MYSIGEFSKITGLTVKTLRFYQEEGVLAPSAVDEETGYRYYGADKIEAARVVARLRELDFPLAEIARIVHGSADEGDWLDRLERHRRAVRTKAQHYREIEAEIARIISTEREARALMAQSTFVVEEKTVAPMLIAGVRMRGRYCDCGRGFAQIGRRFGRQICGKPLLLHYDTEYKAEDADFEACMPIRRGTAADGIAVRELPGGRCVALVHQGAYDELGRSYEKILAYIHEHGYAIGVPSREVYLKGPGMIFRGNPKRYLTEIQMFLETGG